MIAGPSGHIHRAVPTYMAESCASDGPPRSQLASRPCASGGFAPDAMSNYYILGGDYNILRGLTPCGGSGADGADNEPSGQADPMRAFVAGAGGTDGAGSEPLRQADTSGAFGAGGGGADGAGSEPSGLADTRRASGAGTGGTDGRENQTRGQVGGAADVYIDDAASLDGPEEPHGWSTMLGFGRIEEVSYRGVSLLEASVANTSWNVTWSVSAQTPSRGGFQASRRPAEAEHDKLVLAEMSVGLRLAKGTRGSSRNVLLCPLSRVTALGLAAPPGGFGTCSRLVFASLAPGEDPGTTDLEADSFQGDVVWLLDSRFFAHLLLWHRRGSQVGSLILGV